ncbi:MAG: carbon-nitrogen hydrolase family protein [Bacillota bacterium]
MSRVKIGVAQMECRLGDWEKNLLVARDLAGRCLSLGARLVVFPEMFNTGYVLDDRIPALAEEAFPATIESLSRLSTQHGVYVLAGIPIPGTPKPMNGLVLVTPEGNAAYGGKMHLCHVGGDEGAQMSTSSEAFCFDAGGARMGACVCYDVAFPEVVRVLALERAKVVLVPAAWNLSPRAYVYDICTRSRAVENGLWVVTANQTGGPRDSAFFGRSRFVNPKGEVTGEMGGEEGVMVQEVDAGLYDTMVTAGSAYPFLEDRVPGCYGRLVE